MIDGLCAIPEGGLILIGILLDVLQILLSSLVSATLRHPSVNTVR